MDGEADLHFFSGLAVVALFTPNTDSISSLSIFLASVDQDFACFPLYAGIFQPSHHAENAISTGKKGACYQSKTQQYRRTVYVLSGAEEIHIYTSDRLY